MLMIRLRRMGSHQRPFYRVVVSDSRRTPSGRVVDTVGHYDPMKNPKVVEIDVAKIDRWVGKGARLSETVSKLVHSQRKREAAESA